MFRNKKKILKFFVVCREESKLKYYCDEYYPINKLLKKKNKKKINFFYLIYIWVNLIKKMKIKPIKHF